MSQYKVRVTDGLGMTRTVEVLVQQWAYDFLKSAEERQGSEVVITDRGQMFFRRVTEVKLLDISHQWAKEAFALTFKRS